MEKKQKRIEMGNSGRKFIENNFSWEVVVSKFLEEIKNKK